MILADENGVRIVSNRATKPEIHPDVLDAIRKVYATAYGNGYGLTLEEQLEARRMAADGLAEAMLHCHDVRLYKPGEREAEEDAADAKRRRERIARTGRIPRDDYEG